MKTAEKIGIERKEIIEKLAEASLKWSLGAFIGAGFSKSITNKAINWKRLFEEVICILKMGYKITDFEEDYVNRRLLDGNTLPQIASDICRDLVKSNQSEYSDFETAKKFLKSIIRAITAWVPEQEICEQYAPVLENLELDWVITTNYDEIMESLLKNKCYSLSPNDPFIVPKGLLPVYHIHGSRLDPDDLVVTEDDYIKLFRPDKYSQSKLSMLTSESTILVLGYSLSDLNILASIDKGRHVYQVGERKTNEVIQTIYNKDKKDEDLLAYKDDTKGIIVIEINDILKFLKEILEEKEALQQKKIDDEQRWEEFERKFKHANTYFQENFPSIKNSEESDRFWKLIEKDELFNKFISGDRISILKQIVGFINLFNSAIDLKNINQFISNVLEIEKENTRPNGHFKEYKILLATILDILNHMPRKYIDPVWFEQLTGYLGYVLGFTEDTIGNSFEASKYWQENKDNLRENRKEIWEELETRAIVNVYRMDGKGQAKDFQILTKFMEQES